MAPLGNQASKQHSIHSEIRLSVHVRNQRCHSPSLAAGNPDITLVQDLLGTLQIEGDDDVDVAEALDELAKVGFIHKNASRIHIEVSVFGGQGIKGSLRAKVLVRSSDAREYFKATNGFPVILQFFDEAYLRQVASILTVLVSGGWPQYVVHRILRLAVDDTSPRDMVKGANNRLTLLYSDIQRFQQSVAVAVALFLLDIGSEDRDMRNGSYLQTKDLNIATVMVSLGTKWRKMSRVPRLGVMALAKSISRYGQDSTSIDALRQSNVRLLHPTVQLLLKFKPSEKREKNKKFDGAPWFMRPSVLMLLESLVQLAKAQKLLVHEALRKPSENAPLVNTELIRDLMLMVLAFQEASPTKSVRILAWDGETKAYEKRPYPAVAGNHVVLPHEASTLNNLLPEYDVLQLKPSGRSAVELCVQILELFCCGKHIVKELYQHDLIEVLEKFSNFEDDTFKEKVAGAIGKAAAHSKACIEEICEKRSVVGLVGVLESETCLGLERISGAIYDWSGNDYHWFIRPKGGLSQVFSLLYDEEDLPQTKRTLLKPASQVFLACLERSRQMQGVEAPAMPRKEFWSTYSKNTFTVIENKAKSWIEGAGSVITEISSNSTNSTATEKVIPQTKSIKKSPPTTTNPSKECNKGNEENLVEEYDEDGLRLVFDSAPRGQVKTWRQEWKSMALRDKVTWTQTSTDIMIWIKVPKGTKVKEIIVDVTPARLAVKLGWYGRVVDGPLYRRCKSGESMWVLEDDEVHIVLPKDDSHYWKGLFEGGEEKGYMELLQELVDADDTHVSYDDLDDRAKEIIADVHERQQMIHDGLLDIEGFDDFRVVVGENSL
ncbi:hypothetical protein BSKO_00504 [Bryopsis sp. KO-2023]|nr:hypothetical protein BSKO_00504 [Bryopsis sp. KO-2023]